MTSFWRAMERRRGKRLGNGVVTVGLHWYDLLGIVVLGLIVFGPKRLPEMGSSLGKTIREFQKSIREVTDPTPPSSVPPSATQTAQPVAPAPETPPVIAAAPQATVVESSTEARDAATATPLVEEDSVR